MRPEDLVHIVALVLAPLLTSTFADPSVSSPDWAVDGASCRSGAVASEPEWIRPIDPEEHARLESWCRAVGPPALHAPAPGDDSAEIDSIAVVVWNTNVGRAELRRLLGDLRSGALSGDGPVEHFVLLLQEVHREGPEVPDRPADASWAGRIDARYVDEERIDVVDLAWAENLYLFYVPSMRNGSPRDGGRPEDRGNAVLSTLPLNDLAAIELPVERQRRVAVAATVEGRTSAGSPWKLRFVSAHLENRARWARLHRTFGAAQANQARALVAGLDRLEPVEATAIGGDFNTLFGGKDAGAVETLRFSYASLEDHPEGGTMELPLFLPAVRLDHLVMRLPDGWSGRYALIADRYGSDHVPLVGWVRMGGHCASQRNCATSVDSASATVLAVPHEITSRTRSK